LRAALRWAAQGDRVWAVTRDEAKGADLASAGIFPVVADVMAPETLKGLPPADTVLFAVGHDRASGHSIRDLYVDGLSHVLDQLSNSVQRFVYVSSTGVYGQSGDVWVDEDSPCQPTRAGGRACWQAEQLLRDSPWGPRAIILRMAGIYGPGRIPRRRELQAGEVLDAPSEGYLNLIHVDDAASAVIAAERQASLPALYCVSDGQPVIRREYFRELAALLRAAEPQFRPTASNQPAAERASSSKRVSNRRLLVDLKFDLRYPSYRAGLAAIVRTEEAHSASRPS